MDKAQTFLHSYQDTLIAHPGAVVLTAEEARYLPVMVNAGNLYVLHWTIMDYFAKDADPVEYLTFLDHSLNFTKWYQQPKNYQALQTMSATVLSASWHKSVI